MEVTSIQNGIIIDHVPAINALLDRCPVFVLIASLGNHGRHNGRGAKSKIEHLSGFKLKCCAPGQNAFYRFFRRFSGKKIANNSSLTRK